MKSLIFTVLLAAGITANAQQMALKVGDKAPDFIVNVDENTIQSYLLPHMKHLVLLHFWTTDMPKAKEQNLYLKRLLARYENASYQSAEGFEIVSVAIQKDIAAWKKSIKEDSLNGFTHGIAPHGLKDEICKKYVVEDVPTDYLIDETGMIIAINPRFADIENLLDARKNHQALKKDVIGLLAQSSNKADVVKYTRVYLFNYYGDSVYKSVTSSEGYFSFRDVKLNQDFVLKVDNQMDIVTSDPVALYNREGEFIMDGRTGSGGFLFPINTRLSTKLAYTDTVGHNKGAYEEIDVIKCLIFENDGKTLTVKDEQELASIVTHMLKNKNLNIEFTAHTDTRINSVKALEYTGNQVLALKAFFEKKGINPNRIFGIAKGNNQPRKVCTGNADCNDDDHHLNRRVEFLIFKD